jgi:2-oxoglutarate ferredoxin oxidoreductase subunit alpha
MVRGGPGLGNIRGSQADYFQSVKGGGHGDYHLITFAPASLPELYTLTMAAFDYADFYRNPALILGDGILAQLVEPVEIAPYEPVVALPPKDYIVDGCKGRDPRIVRSLWLQPGDSLVKHNIKLKQKYETIQRSLQRSEEYMTDDAHLVIAAYGITARIAKGAINLARKEGLKVGLVRAISVWPFPNDTFARIAEQTDRFLVVEMSNGQFIEDVERATRFKKPIEFLGYGGGWYPTPENILEKIHEVYA